MSSFDFERFYTDFIAEQQRRQLSTNQVSIQAKLSHLHTTLRTRPQVRVETRQAMASWAGLDLERYETGQERARRQYPGLQDCTCVHSDALTCLAEREGTTRFNAMITFATGTRYGACTCPCHRGVKSESAERVRAAR